MEVISPLTSHEYGQGYGQSQQQQQSRAVIDALMVDENRSGENPLITAHQEGPPFPYLTMTLSNKIGVEIGDRRTQSPSLSLLSPGGH